MESPSSLGLAVFTENLPLPIDVFLSTLAGGFGTAALPSVAAVGLVFTPTLPGVVLAGVGVDILSALALAANILPFLTFNHGNVRINKSTKLNKINILFIKASSFVLIYQTRYPMEYNSIKKQKQKTIVN
jgi:hypothetical protein